MSTHKPLRGTRIVSLALNLPGPAALMRLAQLGARCTKVNPPAGDPMQHYTPEGYAQLHAGVKEVTLDLKDAKGQASLHKLLAQSDILLTSFRPSALTKLGLGWKARKLKEDELVGDLAPLLHRLTHGQEISGLKAYEQ